MVNFPYEFGSKLRDELTIYYKKNNIPEPSEISRLYQGRKNETFLESELDLITSLSLDRDTVKYIDYFNNIKELHFESEKGISNVDLIRVLKKYKDIEKLSIIGQRGIQHFDLSNNKKLVELNISSNRDLFKVDGLDKLNDLYEFKFYNNTSYKFNDQLVEDALSVAERIAKIELDVLLYPRLLEYFEDKSISSTRMMFLLDSIKWTEDIGVYNINSLTYNNDEMAWIYENAKKVVDSYIKKNDDDKTKFAVLYEWMCENVKYDGLALDTSDRIHRSGNLVYGKAGGVNGTYNALIYKECVCQGYSKAMQLLLEIAGITSWDIPCYTREDTIKNVLDSEKLSGDHSIIKVNLDGTCYYSDVTWDASMFQNGRDRKYFLLSKDDISKDHKLQGENEVVLYGSSINENEFKRLIATAKSRFKKDELNEMFENEHVDETHKQY